MPHGEQPQFRLTGGIHGGREAFRVNAVRDVKHPFRAEPAREIRHLTARHHHGGIDAGQKVFVENFKTVFHPSAGKVKRGNQRTRQPRALAQQKIQLLIAV